MKLLTKIIAICMLLLVNASAYASRCQAGAYGACIWAFDQKDPENVRLINSPQFLAFCDRNNIFCTSHLNGYHAIMGRYFDHDLYIIASKGWGGPDLILESKDDAQRFANEIKGITNNPAAFFFIKNDPHPKRNAVAVCYKEKTAEGKQEIRLYLLPNEWDETGDNYIYVPPDM